MSTADGTLGIGAVVPRVGGTAPSQQVLDAAVRAIRMDWFEAGHLPERTEHEPSTRSILSFSVFRRIL